MNRNVGNIGLSLRKQIEFAPGLRMFVTITVADNGELVFSDGAGTPISRRLVDQARKQHGLAIPGLIRAASKKVNREVEALGQVHLESPSPLARPAYRPLPFSLKEPSTPVFRQKWLAQREAHRAAGDARRTFIERDILESESAMEAHLWAALQKVQWPGETGVSFEVSPGGSSVLLDVDLTKIADFPARTASVPARGCRVSIKEMAPARKEKLYLAHVHGVAFRVIAETFAALPTVRQVTLFGYPQRADYAAGDIRDDHLYAVGVSRDEWEAIDFAELGTLDVTEALARFDLRRKAARTGSFGATASFKQEPMQTAA